jgi:hypothetical protein
MSRTRALMPAIAVAWLVTLLSACSALGARSRDDHPAIRECTNYLHIGLEGILPETLTVQVIDPANTSCTRHCPTALEGDPSRYRVLEQVLTSSPRFKELSQNLPPGSLCATGGQYRVAEATLWEDGSLRTLGFCCSDTPPDQAGLGLSAPTCVYRGARLGELHVSGFAPEQLTLVFYLPHRTITTTVIPDYDIYTGIDETCKGTKMTIDLESLQD